MSTITVSGARVSNVGEALQEVDAVVEALKERAEVVLRMLGHEAGIGPGVATSSGDGDAGGLATAAKGAGVMLAGKATKAAAGTAVQHEANKAKRTAKRTARRSKAAPVALGDVVKGKAAELAGTTTGAVKDLAGSTSGTVKGLAADLGGNAAGKAAELTGVAKGKAAELVGAAKGASKAAPKRRVWPWALGIAGVVALVVVWLRVRGRVQELAAVDNTAPDEFGAVVERAELAGSLPPQR